MSKIETKQINLVSENGLVEKTLSIDNSGVVRIDGIEQAGIVSGTFTPSIAFGGNSVGVTYNETFRYGSYVKIGKVVNFTAVCVLTSKGSSTGSASMTGLPFPIGKITAFAVQLVTVAYTGTVLAKGEAGASSINFLQVSEGGGVTPLTHASFGQIADYVISGSYITA